MHSSLYGMYNRAKYLINQQTTHMMMNNLVTEKTLKNEGDNIDYWRLEFIPYSENTPYAHSSIALLGTV